MVQGMVQTQHSYIYLRRKTYYFRLVIPSRLRQLCPSLPREIKRSLRTDSLTDALAMVGDKLPLIRLLKACSSGDVLQDIYRRLSDFSHEIGGWIKAKLALYPQKDDREEPVSQKAKGTPIGPKLDKAWRDFRSWKTWTDKRASLNQRMYDNLRHFLGDVPVGDISKRDIKAALAGISLLPQGNKKQYKSIPREKLCKMVIPPEDRVSAKYVKEHLKLCQSLFSRYLKNERDIIKVAPTEGLRWEYENNRYGCLSDIEVKQIMDRGADKPEWFRWFMLLAIYSGARRGEIAGLTRADIKLCPDSQRHYFMVREGKTKAARRAVPIHGRLIESGFLEWVNDSRGRLFDTAYRNPNRVTDLFGSMMDRKVNDYGDRLVFHSLRHTFITKSRAAGSSDVQVQQVVGHEKRGAGQTDRYTHTFQLKDVLGVVDSVDYGC